MNTKRTLWIILLFLVFAPMVRATRAADDKPLQNPALKRFYSELRMLFRKHYPEVTSHLLGDTIHFEHDTRLFIVHEALMTGQWQDPWAERGPKPGGILCDITLEKGPYNEQAGVPQTFDKRYFKVLLMAPDSTKRDVHLHVKLSYPGNVKADFLKSFGKLVNDFENYLD